MILLAIILIALIVWAIASLRSRGEEKVVDRRAAVTALYSPALEAASAPRDPGAIALAS